MTDRPMIFSAPMIKALIEGRKTQTRRIAKPQGANRWWQAKTPSGATHWFCDVRHSFGTMSIMAPPYAPGDRLWVRETWRSASMRPDDVNYRADGESLMPWRSPIHMPRWASRLTLTVTDVRVQRVQDISEADAQAEGLVAAYEGWATDQEGRHWGPTARDSYRVLWNDLHGPDAWARNDWVAALTFTVHRQNIDTGSNK